jgi:Putative DNA-binding domain
MRRNCSPRKQWPHESHRRATRKSMNLHADFHSRFMRAVDHWRDGEPPEPGTIDGLSVPAFAVFANTGLRACVDALAATYPSVSNWLGELGFWPLAAKFARAHPPTDSRLFLYGRGFADHLRALDLHGDWPCLADLARIDRCRTEAHAAFDAHVLTSAELAQLPTDALEATVLVPTPATRWHQSSESPVLDLWAMARQGKVALQSIRWRGQAVLITRPDDEVLMHELPLAGITLLEACARAQPLGAAAAAAQATDPGVDLPTLFATLFAQGAFRSLAPYPDPSLPTPRKIP